MKFTDESQFNGRLRLVDQSNFLWRKTRRRRIKEFVKKELEILIPFFPQLKCWIWIEYLKCAMEKSHWIANDLKPSSFSGFYEEKK